MKSLKFYATILLCAIGMTACMNEDWQAPDFKDNPPYGNNEIVPCAKTKITIAQLKAKYGDVFGKQSGFKKISEDLQLHVVVNGNDQGGNIYKQISVQDETGGIIIGINATDLYAMMPVGQKLVINLKGLYVGTYGSMAQIGSEYNGGLGRMELTTWKDCVRLVEDEVVVKTDENKTETIYMTSVVDTIDFTPASDYNSMIGRIVKISNAKISGEGTQTLAPEDGSVYLTSNCANRNIVGAATNKVVLRTSTYSDFATREIPKGNVDIYGVCTYFNGTWQILMRTNSDLKEL